MKTVFADAGYWVAAVHPREDLHDKALQVSSSLGPHLIVTSEMVLSEFAAYFSDKGPRLRQAVVDLIRSIRANPNSRVFRKPVCNFKTRSGYMNNPQTSNGASPIVLRS